MKRVIIFCALFLIGCTSGPADEWDSGAKRRRDLNQQRMEDINENVNNQFPSEAPGTERDQPF